MAKMVRTKISDEEVKPVEQAVEEVKPVVEEVKPLNVTAVLSGGVAVMSIRLIGNAILFNDGMKNRRVYLIKGKPVTITMRQ